jgi:hypothetical protein
VMFVLGVSAGMSIFRVASVQVRFVCGLTTS